MIKTALYNKLKSYDFEKLFKKKGYAYFTKGIYNLNIIGVRSQGNRITNAFDDYLVLIYKTPNNQWQRQIYNITTDPGLAYALAPMNGKGAAILVPGQYRGTYKIDKHQGKYYALCQKKPVKVYRDGNKDRIYDWDVNTQEEGIYGINIHKAGTDSKQVDKWSAGCQVFANAAQFKSFMDFCHKQIDATSCDSFTYTLVKEEDL